MHRKLKIFFAPFGRWKKYKMLSIFWNSLENILFTLKSDGHLRVEILKAYTILYDFDSFEAKSLQFSLSSLEI